jgi:flavin-dependent dehydrogenase
MIEVKDGSERRMNTLSITKNVSSRMRQTVHDVIVVGGRVAGASTAMLLARRGLRVLVLERAPASGTDTLSTFALMRPGVLQLRRWGLLERIVATGAPAVRSTVLHYGDEVVVVPIKEKAGVDALYAPRRTILDPILVEAAVESGAEVRYGSIVTELVWMRDRVVGVRGRDRDGRAFEALAPLVIGADGRHSLVARAVRAPVTWEGRTAGGTVYGFWSGLHVDGYEWFYRPGVGAGVIPTNDGQVLVWVGTDAARLLTEIRGGGVESGFDRLLREAAPEIVDSTARAHRVGQFHGFPGMSSSLRRPWGSGWALVGDAGSFRDPISAHGISDALRDAELLARAVPEYLGDSLDESALAGYEELRNEAALPLAEITDRVSSYRWTLDELWELLLNLSKAMGHEAELLVGLGSAPALAA